MNGIKYLLDTNIIIGMYQHNETIFNLFQTNHVKISECAYSAITRIELLSFPSLTEFEKTALTALLDRMAYLSLSLMIENEAITFRQRHNTKLPDSIIAATARCHHLELLTLDKKLAAKLKV